MKPKSVASKYYLTAAIFCLVGFFWIGSSGQGGPGKASVTDWRVGLPFSPWWRIHTEHHAKGDFQFQAGIEFLSWSWLLLLAGLLLLRRRRAMLRESLESGDARFLKSGRS